MTDSCHVCKKTAPEVSLKRCAKCSTTQYCSRECQKADWKVHRKTCGRDSSKDDSKASEGSSATEGQLSPPRGLDAGIAKPFTRLDNNTWLHGRSETDVYRILLDAYRLQVDDDYKLKGEIQEDSIYNGAKSGLVGFTRFMRAVTASGLLPSWWTPEHETACKKLGKDKTQFQCLSHAVEKADIIEHYGDRHFPMQLRMFTEEATGVSPGGFGDGKAMRQMMMGMESGAIRHASHISF